MRGKWPVLALSLSLSPGLGLLHSRVTLSALLDPWRHKIRDQEYKQSGAYSDTVRGMWDPDIGPRPRPQNVSSSPRPLTQQTRRQNHWRAAIWPHCCHREKIQPQPRSTDRTCRPWTPWHTWASLNLGQRRLAVNTDAIHNWLSVYYVVSDSCMHFSLQKSIALNNGSTTRFNLMECNRNQETDTYLSTLISLALWHLTIDADVVSPKTECLSMFNISGFGSHRPPGSAAGFWLVVGSCQWPDHW